MLLNYLYAATSAICLATVPFAVWDHLVPHVDPQAEYHEHVEREAEKAAARLFEEWREQCDREAMNREMNEWRIQNGYQIWDERQGKFVDPPKGCSVEAPYVGTCGPPDNGR